MTHHFYIDWPNVGLGADFDGAIAKRLGVHRETVRLHRKRLRIKAYDGPRPVNLPPVRLDSGVWASPEARALLGKVYDRELAARLGVTKQAVWLARKARGIPAYRIKALAQRRNAHVTRLDTGVWADPANVARLGTMPDPDLAAALNLTRQAVAQARKARGIKSYTEHARDQAREWEERLAIKARMEARTEAKALRRAAYGIT